MEQEYGTQKRDANGATYLQSATRVPGAESKFSEDAAGEGDDRGNFGAQTRKEVRGSCGSTRSIAGTWRGSRRVSHQCRGRGDATAGGGATEYISEAWLIPVLEAMLRQFPFQIFQILFGTAVC